MRRYRLRYSVVDRDGNTVDIFDTKREAKAARDKLELADARFAHPSFSGFPVDKVRGEFSECRMEMRDVNGEWQPYCDIKSQDEMERASRLIGYGNNHDYYRVIDCLTGIQLLPPPAA